MTGPCYTGIFTAVRNFIPQSVLYARDTFGEIFAFGKILGEKKEERRFISIFIIIRLWSFIIYIYRLLEPGIIKDVRRKIHEINREIRGV